MDVVRDYIQDKGHNGRALRQPLSEISFSIRTCIHVKPHMKVQWIKCDKPSTTVLGALCAGGWVRVRDFCLLTLQPPSGLARKQFKTSSEDQISYSKEK